ncbi:MAG: hypothetical protein JW838_09625 [Spirochaetes bacterium]|nr:hypothetical protein [Spirochaetota bacterium]
MNQDQREYQEIRDTILMVKGRFKATALNLYGQFMLVFKNESQFDSFNAVISTYSDLYNLEPHEDWTKYREQIANVKWKGNFNRTMTASIMDQFKKFSEEMNSISLLYSNVADYDYNAMDITLFDLVNRIVHDKNLVLETAIQELPPSEYRASLGSGEQKADEVTAGGDEFTVDDDSVILPVKPIVAPVKGKPIYELRVGDRLMVYILPQSDRANYFIDLLNLRDEREIIPTPAEVIDIKSGTGKNNPTDILTMIAKGIYGKFTETEKQVKLKLHNPAEDGSPSGRKKTGTDGAPAVPAQEEGLSFSKGTMVMLSLLLVILILFIVLIFVSW